MVKIGSALVSFDIFEKMFFCNLNECKGMCCVLGESGAPLENNEVTILQEIYPKIKPYMTFAGIEVVEQKGVYDTDIDYDKTTPLIGNSEDCAYSYKENGVSSCAIEKAFTTGEIDFRKPVSCHLFPIRITNHGYYDAVNFQHWDICKNSGGKPLYIFLKEPLIRKYGIEWYDELCLVANELSSHQMTILKNNKI